ncbi:oxygenase MpaB family protein [Kineosporia succinea]|uniref:ER-bound oxygenase mpaB/mpaB'/Rubber oxygenase catalytic domain-containing protein n=1 Tax=Kineosporia succinea TaxID=84632 RepID=A0ABT9P7X4_9ACTN|nr:oxygenase MpaB family protein [Kineosporia succinea]MDP9828808.1 hypothetical protein [Kineosporia succinea]
MGHDADRSKDLDQRYRELAMSTFVFETRLAHRLSYFRVFASPRIAGLLKHTGQMQAEPGRRAHDTGLLMYSLIDAGLDSETGSYAISRLNEMHRRWRITNDDYTYVLGTFAVMSVRMIVRTGWRPITEAEKQLVIDWHAELGARLGITDVPGDFASFDAWFTAYEARMLRRSAAGQELLKLALEVVGSQIPPRLRRPTMALAPVLIDEPARSALGFAPPGLTARATVSVLLRFRAWRRRRNGPPPAFFTLGAPNGTYPAGWTIEDLGPRDLSGPRKRG